MTAVESDCGAIAEMAMAARDLRELETGWLEYLKPSIGFETACSVWSESSGTVRGVTAFGYGEVELGARFPSYMCELSRRELACFSAATPAVDLDVVSPARRQQLMVYRELLWPHGIGSFVTNVWQAPWGVFGFHMGRTRGVPFGDRQARRLQLLLPCIKLGQSLLVRQQNGSSNVESGWWAADWSLSPRECEVAGLVMRGFRNPEIATLLRISTHTVRNHLVSIFRKADVSNRTELVFTMVGAPEARRQRGGLGRSAWSAFLGQSASRRPSARQ